MADKKDAKEKKATKQAAKKAAAPKATAKAAPKAAAAKPKAAPKRAVARPVTRAAAPATAPKRVEKPKAEAAAPKPKREPRPLPSAPAGKAPVIGTDGVVAGTVDLPAAIASVKKRAGVLFQALTASAANARQANATTKNRARVSGGGAKPWRQKGTGRARAGSTRSPLWRHGGVVFGPNGRRFWQRMPEKMRRAAFAEALASCAGEGRFMVYDGLPFNGDRPKTKVVMGWLDKVGDTGRALFVTGEIDAAAATATANARDVGLRTVGTLRTEDVLWHDTLFVRRDALEQLAARATVGGGAA
jgi:large subunit ribosomal protein L4